MVFFALMASLMVNPFSTLRALGIYGLTVVLGLFIMAFYFFLSTLLLILKVNQ
jgi:hypothetical protein